MSAPPTVRTTEVMGSVKAAAVSLVMTILAAGIGASAQEASPKTISIAGLSGKYLRFDERGHFWTLTIRKDGTFKSNRFVGSAQDIAQPREGVASVSGGSLFLVVPPGTEWYVFTPASFGQRMYLLSKGTELGFCIDVAKGREPRRSVIGEALLRQGDERISIPQGTTPDVCKEP
jgi:hypothetical protein